MLTQSCLHFFPNNTKSQSKMSTNPETPPDHEDGLISDLSDEDLSNSHDLTASKNLVISDSDDDEDSDEEMTEADRKFIADEDEDGDERRRRKRRRRKGNLTRSRRLELILI